MTDPSHPSSGDPLRSGDPAPSGAEPSGRNDGPVDLGKSASSPAWGEPERRRQWGEPPPAAGGWAPPASGSGTDPAAGHQWGQPAGRPPGWDAPPGAPEADSPTPLGLILSILGAGSVLLGVALAPLWLLSLPLSVAGWVISSRELRARPGDGASQAGRIVGIIGTVLSVLGILVILLIVGVIVAAFSAA